MKCPFNGQCDGDLVPNTYHVAIDAGATHFCIKCESHFTKEGEEVIVPSRGPGYVVHQVDYKKLTN